MDDLKGFNECDNSDIFSL